MGFEEKDQPYDLVSCSICLDAVRDRGDRSTTMLQCGHEFHLDCIGSAFNAKGEMQCPNCRKIEKGEWLCKWSSSDTDCSMDDWSHDEDSHETSDSEMAETQEASSEEDSEDASPTSTHGVSLELEVQTLNQRVAALEEECQALNNRVTQLEKRVDVVITEMVQNNPSMKLSPD